MDYRRKPLAILCVVLMMVTLLPLQLFAVSENLANQRIGGADRYATAAAISQAGWQTAENVILAGGGDANLVDALSAAPLAKLLSAPILISESGRLTPVTAAELRRLEAKTAYVVSGSAVITQAVQNELQTMGITVVRLGGADRFATSQNIAREVIRRGGVDTVVITTAYTNADALSIASIAAAGGWPILLSGANGLSAEARAIISEISPTRTYVIGGTGAVSAAAVADLPGVTRLGGADRYATNVEILRHFADQFDYSKGLFVANGANNHLVDALCASAYIAGAPLFINGNGGLGSSEYDVLSNVLRLKDFSQLTSLGGTGSISETTLTTVHNALLGGGEETPPATTGGGGGGGGGGGPSVSNAVPDVTDVMPGAAVTVTVSGVRLNNNVTVGLYDGSGTKVADATLNAGGSATSRTYTLTVPADLPVGDYTVRAYVGASLKQQTPLTVSSVDKPALDALIDEAVDSIVGVVPSPDGVVSSVDGSALPEGTPWVTPAVYQNLEDTIAAAVAVSSDPEATPAMRMESAAALQAALAAVEDALQVVGVTDKDDLNDAIEAAQANLHSVVISAAGDGSDVAHDQKWVIQSVYDAYEDTVVYARTVADDPDATQAEVNAALEDLNTATDVFNAEKTPADVDTSALEAAIEAANDNLNSVYRSTAGDGSDITGGKAYWATPVDHDAYAGAIATAESVAGDPASQAAVDAAEADLAAATVLFEGAKHPALLEFIPQSFYEAVDEVTTVGANGTRTWIAAEAYAAKQTVVEQPIQGYFTHNFPTTNVVPAAERNDAVAALADREFQVYIPKHSPQRTYVNVIGVPDGVLANEFLYERGWFEAADDNGEILVVLLPGPDGWGSPAEEELYIKAVVGMNNRLGADGSIISPTTSGIFGVRQPSIYLPEPNTSGQQLVSYATSFAAIGNIYIPLYFVGYGEACAPLEAHTSYVPENVIAQAFIGGTSAGSAILNQSALRVHAGHNNGLFADGYADNVFIKQLQSIIDSLNPNIGGQPVTTDFITNADIPVPTLLAGDYTAAGDPSLDYWKSVNHTAATPDADGVYQELIDNGSWATHYANENIKNWNPGAEYGISKVKATEDTDMDAAGIREFLTEFNRMNNFTAYSDTLSYRVPYQELNVTAREYAEQNVPMATIAFDRVNGTPGQVELRAHEPKDVDVPNSGTGGGGTFHLAIFAYEDRDAAIVTDNTLDGRDVYIYVPDSAKGGGPVPAILGIPGTQNGSIQYFGQTQWWSVANDEGFVVVIFGQDYSGRTTATGSPQGITESGLASGANYVLALEELLKSEELDIGVEIDWGRFYASGFSAGAAAMNSIVISGSAANHLDDHFAALYNHSNMSSLSNNLTAELMPTYFAIASPEGSGPLLAEPWNKGFEDTGSGSSIITNPDKTELPNYNPSNPNPLEGTYNSVMYLTSMNGINFSFSATSDLDDSRDSYEASVVALGGELKQEGRFINTTFMNWQGIDLVKFTRVLGREHNPIPDEMRLGWEYVSRFRIDPATGDRFFSPSAFADPTDEIAIVKEASAKEALTDAITAAQANLDLVNVDGPTVPWVTQAVKDAYQDAIDLAQSEVDKLLLDQAALVTALADLAVATDAFEAQITGADKTALETDIGTALSNLASAKASEDGNDVSPAEFTDWVMPADAETYDTAIKEAQAVFENPVATQDEVDDAETALGLAGGTFDSAKILVNVSTTDLTTAIGTANTDLTNVTPSTNGAGMAGNPWMTPNDYEAYEDVFDAAQVALTASQNAVDQAVLDLTAAREIFKTAIQGVNRPALVLDVEEALNYLNDDTVTVSTDGDGTDVSLEYDFWVTQTDYDNYEDVIEAAQLVLDDTGSTLSDVANALTALNAAITYFNDTAKIPVAVDTAALEMAIETAMTHMEGIELDDMANIAADVFVSEDGLNVLNGKQWLNEDDYNDYADAITAAQEVLGDTTATQDDVDAAETAMTSATGTFEGIIAGNTVAVDTTALDAAISDAETNRDTPDVSEDGLDVSNGDIYVPSGAKDAYNGVIEDAQEASGAAETQGAVNDAEAALAEATIAFNAAKIRAGIDKGALGTALETAQGYLASLPVSDGTDLADGTDYVTQGYYDDYKAVIDAAQAIFDDMIALQNDVDTMVNTTLPNAYTVFDGAKLTASVDKSTLATDIGNAQNNLDAVLYVSDDGSGVLAGNIYVPQSAKTDYETAIGDAQDVSDDPEATVTGVAGAVTALAAATSDFDGAKVRAGIDKTLLGTAISGAESRLADVDHVQADATGVEPGETWVTQGAYEAYEDAIEAAQAVFEDAIATQAEVLQAWFDLDTATDTFALAVQTV